VKRTLIPPPGKTIKVKSPGAGVPSPGAHNDYAISRSAMVRYRACRETLKECGMFSPPLETSEDDRGGHRHGVSKYSKELV